MFKILPELGEALDNLIANRHFWQASRWAAQKRAACSHVGTGAARGLLLLLKALLEGLLFRTRCWWKVEMAARCRCLPCAISELLVEGGTPLAGPAAD